MKQVNTQNQKIIFGLKVKQLRQEQRLSFSELSKRSNMSVSYLNEIEKGKKFPKEDKIKALAKGLDTTYENLTSLELGKTYKPLADLIKSNFLKELPLELFGIDASKVIEIIANSPSKVNAFISTLLDIARKYELQQEGFYYAAMRSYQELHYNYFEEIEVEVKRFIQQHRLPNNGSVNVDALYQILKKDYHYTIDKNGFAAYPDLKKLRYVFDPEKKKLIVNSELNPYQQAFLLGKEIAINYLGLDERINTSTIVRTASFEQIHNNIKAAYFSGAMLMNEDSFVKDLKNFFNQTTWQPEMLSSLMEKYNASPEMFLHRMTSLIPRHFGLDEMFFLKFNNVKGRDFYTLTKELHFNRQHHPHGNDIHEHYCRRWITLWLLQDLYQAQINDTYTKPIIGIQRSKYIGTTDEYLCITIVRPSAPTPDTNTSVTVGFLVDDRLKSKMKFLEDDAIVIRDVNKTCERCNKPNCKERTALPSIIQEKDAKKRMQTALKSILNN